ncbi:MAG: hypothetical protein ACI4U5_04150 [Bacilli bacterium]
MTFFVKFFKTIFIYFILLCTAILITSFVYYRHKVENKIEEKEIEILQKEEVKFFYAYQRSYLHINVSFFDKKKSSYLIAYTFTYFDKYKEKIELLDVDNGIIVVVDQGIGYITYSSNKDLITSTI